MENNILTSAQITSDVMIDKEMKSIDNELLVAMHLIIKSGTRQTTGKELYEALGEARLNLMNKAYARKGTQLGFDGINYNKGYINALSQVLYHLEDTPEVTIHDLKGYLEANIKEAKEDGI